MNDTNTPVASFSRVSFSYGDQQPLFRSFSGEIPPGIVGVVGPNGIGKTTFLLLAAGRLFPSAGNIRMLGVDTKTFKNAGRDPNIEERRNRSASFVYQNMEFETDEPISEVLAFVNEARSSASVGADRVATGDPLDMIVEKLELQDDLRKQMQQLSKGASQRTVIAMSLLYGAPLLLMDEPVFAVEPERAERVFAYLVDYARRSGVSIIFSAHDVEFTRRHSQHAALFFESDASEEPVSDASLPDVCIGPVAETLTREQLEAAFRAPYDTLKKRESLYREMLRQ